jgi:uncharacterized protein YciI
MGIRGQFVYLVHPIRPEMLTSGPTPAETEILERHSGYLKDLAEKGTVLIAGRTQNNDESTFGLVIFEADSEEEARGIMSQDPAVSHKVMRAQLFPYRIAVKNVRS